MLEKETERIVGVIGQRTIGNTTSVAMKDILAADIPQTVKSFFRADVEAMLYEEHRAAVKRSRFNLDHPDVRSAQSQLHSAMVLHFTFSRKEYLDRLNDAIHLLANYLVRPQWTLSGVVFEKDNSITLDTLRRLLLYFSPYDYIRDVLFRYSEDKNISTFSKDEFTAIIWKIDGAYLRRKSGLELANTLLPLFEFFDYPRNTGKNSMPVKALIRFFDDKGLTDVQTRLEGEMAQGLQELPSVSLAEILEDVRITAGQFKVERASQQSSETPSGPALAKPPADPDGLDPDSATLDSGPGGSGNKSVPDITGAITEPEKRKFVRKIFRQDEDAFNEAIAQLNRMSGWKDASRHIDEIFITNDVDPYSAEAERFIEIVFNQFHPSR